MDKVAKELITNILKSVVNKLNARPSLSLGLSRGERKCDIFQQVGKEGRKMILQNPISCSDVD